MSIKTHTTSIYAGFGKYVSQPNEVFWEYWRTSFPNVFHLPSCAFWLLENTESRCFHTTKKIIWSRLELSINYYQEPDLGNEGSILDLQGFLHYAQTKLMLPPLIMTQSQLSRVDFFWSRFKANFVWEHKYVA